MIVSSKCKHTIGGQAVMEGVMVRSRYNMAVAVRRPDKKISVRKTEIDSWQKKWSFFRWPFIRGIYSLFETLITGIEALTYSANESIEDGDDKISKKELVITLGIAILFAVGLFVILPFVLSRLITKDDFAFNIIDGVIRIFVFLLYILIISRIKDIKTIFQYHGAEHKAVHAYEAGKKLTVKEAKPFSTLHPRCGTSFLIIVLVISIIVFSLIMTKSWIIKLLSRIILLPIIAGVSYEFLKLTAKYQGSSFFRIISVPGLALQRLTTSEPDDKQLEVALKSLSSVLSMENGK